MKGNSKRATSQILLSALVLLLAGCWPTVYIPIPVSGKLSLPKDEFEVIAPDGWYRLMQYAGRGAPGGPLETAEIPEGLVLTRDGVLLQQIRVQRVGVDEKLEFTKRRFDVNLPTQEVAEIELEDHRSDPIVYNFSLVENAPATVDGRRGFKLVYTWTTRDGYRLKGIHYGFMEGKWVYRIIYQAAARHYFDRDLPTFEKLRDSFRLLTKPA